MSANKVARNFIGRLTSALVVEYFSSRLPADVAVTSWCKHKQHGFLGTSERQRYDSVAFGECSVKIDNIYHISIMLALKVKMKKLARIGGYQSTRHTVKSSRSSLA